MTSSDKTQGSPDRLRAWREARGWTQARAAEATGYSLDTWKSYETGRLRVSRRVWRMVELLGLV